MKNVFKISIAFIVLALLVSCDDELEKVIDPGNEPIPNNELRSIELSEDLYFSSTEIEKEVTLKLNKPASKNGVVNVRFGEDFTKFFHSELEISSENRASIPILIGDQEISFQVSVHVNEIPESNAFVHMEITGVSEGFVIGTRKTIKFSVKGNPDSEPVSVDFLHKQDSVVESETSAHVITIKFSSKARTDGKILVGVEGNEDYFHTEPATNSNGKIELLVTVGMSEISFQVLNHNDGLIKGHQSIAFNIEETWGGIIVGTELSYHLTILDDELVSKPKSYETISKDWKSKKTYFYDEQGRIDKIEWTTHTPFERTGTDQYYYGSNGLIERINHYPNIDEYFFYENNRIVRSEEVKNGVITQYSLYDYDWAGNVSGQALYNRNSNGEYVESFVFVYLFTFSGDLYKQLTYIPVDSEEEYELIATTSFDAYGDELNPFPVFEILPNHQSQVHLPLKYSFEGNGSYLEYNITYDFREDGLPIRRKVAESWGIEITTYEYY